VFAALVSHCAKRRKTDFVEGLFGYASEVPYTMFAAAVFWEPAPHDDCEVSVGEIATYVCTNGRWRRHLACEAHDTNRDLGLAMHCCDYELRQQLDYPYPLKQRKAPKYLWKMVHDVVAHRLEERAEAERRRISIDLSKLGGIRAAAEQTQEALLTDEERDLPQAEPTVPWAEPSVPQVSLFPAEVTDATGQSSVAQPAPVRPTATQPAVTAPSPAAPPSPVAPSPTSETASNDLGLSPLELRFLTGLLDGTPASQLLSPTDPFASVVADSINDKLFDLIGDAVIEFDGDEPLIIEDYLEDIREVL
jgi:hypothetical protein